MYLPMQIYFHDDAFEDPIEILHHLRLYADNDSSAQQSTKKPVSTQSPRMGPNHHHLSAA